MRSGKCYRQQKWGHPTDGRESLLWLTPNVPNGGRKPKATDLQELVANKGRTKRGKRQVGLENQVQAMRSGQATSESGSLLWPTITVAEAPNKNANIKRWGGMNSLTNYTQAWVAPEARDGTPLSMQIALFSHPVPQMPMGGEPSSPDGLNSPLPLEES